jgi:hypothetical protein
VGTDRAGRAPRPDRGDIVGFRVGIGILRGKVVEALSPDSEIAEIRVGWSSVEVEGLRIKGQKGVEAAGQAAKGARGALQRLFGGSKKR